MIHTFQQSVHHLLGDGPTWLLRPQIQHDFRITNKDLSMNLKGHLCRIDLVCVISVSCPRLKLAVQVLLTAGQGIM